VLLVQSLSASNVTCVALSILIASMSSARIAMHENVLSFAITSGCHSLNLSWTLANFVNWRIQSGCTPKASRSPYWSNSEAMHPLEVWNLYSVPFSHQKTGIWQEVLRSLPMSKST
jgi:hypothetical protein